MNSNSRARAWRARPWWDDALATDDAVDEEGHAIALAVSKTYVAAEVLFASDLNLSLTTIHNNALALISPLTGNLDVDGFDLQDTGELEFRDEAADPTADGRLRRTGDVLKLRTQDARTATVARPWALWADTTGAPAAGIGVGMTFQGESADENPSDFGDLDFVASDIGAGTEDTYASIRLRVAGRALDEKYRFSSTAGDGFAALFAHAVTADRTYTLPDADTTLGGLARAGGSVTEVTTTDTTDADRVTISGLSIAATQGLFIVVGFAKSSGAAATVELGLKLNTTVLGGDARAVTDATNEDQAGVCVFIVPARLAGAAMGYSGGLQIFAADGTAGENSGTFSINERPNATITDVVIRGRTANGLVTLGIMGVHVYVLPSA